jgi:hypothetical protein
VNCDPFPALPAIHNNSMERRLGQRDATMRFGVKDAPLWRCERVLAFATSCELHPGPGNAPTFYTFREGARFVGVTEQVAKRIFPKETPAVLVPVQDGEPSTLWPESWLHAIRRMIASGEIAVRPSSLTKPKLGVRASQPPRHCWAEDQSQESQLLAKATNSVP